MEKKITTLTQEQRIESCLTEDLHEMAVALVKSGKRTISSYTLEEVEDEEMVNVWIADAHSEGEEDYAEMLRKALASGADIYTLTDHLGGFSQPIGEVVVY